MGKSPHRAKIKEAARLVSKSYQKGKSEELIKLSRDQALNELAEIALGLVCDVKQTASGDVFEQPPPAKDRKDAIALIAKIEGWIGEDGEKKDGQIKVGILKPAPRGEE